MDWLYAIETAANEEIESQLDHEAEEFYLLWFSETRTHGFDELGFN